MLKGHLSLKSGVLSSEKFLIMIKKGLENVRKLRKHLRAFLDPLNAQRGLSSLKGKKKILGGTIINLKLVKSRLDLSSSGDVAVKNFLSVALLCNPDLEGQGKRISSQSLCGSMKIRCGCLMRPLAKKGQLMVINVKKFYSA